MTTVNEAIGVGPTTGATRNRAPLIIIVGADKGGVGKTTVARALTDYLQRKGVKVRAFDTESGEGVLKRFVPAARLIDGATVPGQMAVVDSAAEDAVTLVDARAGLLGPILKAFHRIDLLRDVKEGTLRLLVLHVVGPSMASAAEITPVMEALEGANLIRVDCETAPDVTFPPAVDGEVTMKVPYLDAAAYEAVDGMGQSFATFGTEAPSRVLRGQVSAWLRDVHTAFDHAGIGAML